MKKAAKKTEKTVRKKVIKKSKVETMKQPITDNDIITEVGSICACNSTHAFSQMINRRLHLEAPDLQVIKFANISTFLQNMEHVVIGVHCQILSGVIGQVSLLFNEKSDSAIPLFILRMNNS